MIRLLLDEHRELLDHLSDAISVLSPEGIILEANERWRSILGFSAKEMIGRHVRDLSPPGMEDLNVETFNRQPSDGCAEAVPMLHRSGSTVYIQFRSNTVRLQGRDVVFSVGRDVTESVLATRGLARAEEKYRLLVERMSDVVVTSNARGEILFVTPNVTQLTGFDLNEVKALGIAEFYVRIIDDDRARVVGAIDDALRVPTKSEVEFRWLRRDGKRIWLRVRFMASYIQGGTRCLDCLVADITEKAELTEGLRLAQKMEAIGQLTGGIAHDFNNILSVIMTDCDFLLDSIAPDDPRRNDAAEIKAASARAAALTRQLLAFSRKQRLEPTVVSLNDAIGGVETMLKRLIGEDVRLSVRRAAALGNIRVDLGQLEQVIMNLAVNARDAMPNGGVLELSTSSVKIVNHPVMTSDSYALLCVRDTGSGMSAETMQRIFEPFFTTKEVGRGTGLGLSTCYGIIRQSSGYIFAESEPGKGTTFKVYLPIVEALASAPVKALAPGSLNGSETILLIEDDQGVRLGVERMLRARGYHVLCAQDCTSAIVLAKEFGDPIALVLSDVVMPGLSGPNCVEQLRPYLKKAKVLFMSGFTEHTALPPSAQVIQKPFDPTIFAKRIRELLQSSGLEPARGGHVVPVGEPVHESLLHSGNDVSPAVLRHVT